jgi:hypothetical protein
MRQRFCRSALYRLWHKADMTIALKRCPLSGVKRTSPFQHFTSAFDPERTSRDHAGRKSVHAVLLTAKIA